MAPGTFQLKRTGTKAPSLIELLEIALEEEGRASDRYGVASVPARRPPSSTNSAPVV